MDTFASEIGREACLIDRSTLSLREPDMYVLKCSDDRSSKALSVHFLFHEYIFMNYKIREL